MERRLSRPAHQHVLEASGASPSAGDLHLHRQGHAGLPECFKMATGIWPWACRRCSKLGTCARTWKTWT